MAEAERLGELYKYFRSAQDIIDTDIDSTEYEPSHARLSQDPVLNALAQLGVHRLDCERAFVSLIDNKNQYVVAEVSESVSLFDADYHPGGTGLCVGVRALDLVSGVCAGTMPAFTDPSGTHHISTPNIIANSEKFVISDFTIEPEYQSRPYVVAFPFMRFYAGVPIRSNSGHVIGTYAVVDNRPREGLDNQGFVVLTEIAASIMRHLELVQVRTNHDSALGLLGSLKSFVQGSNSSADTADAKADAQKQSLPDQISHLDRSQLQGEDQVHPNASLHKYPMVSASSQPHAINDNLDSWTSGRKLDSPQLQPIMSVSSSGVEASQAKVDEEAFALSATHHDSPQGSEPLTVSCQYKSLLGRASASIRAALRMDEVFFVDAPSSTAPLAKRDVAPRLDAPTAARKSRSSSIQRGSTENSPAPCGSHMSESRRPNPCLYTPTEQSIHSRANRGYFISERMHNDLFLQFPAGTLFNFVSKEAETFPTFASPEVYTDSNSKDDKRSNTVREISRRPRVESLGEIVHSAFPAAKSMMYLPLFDTVNRDCPFSIIAWSSENRRILQQEDFSYLGLFGVAIQAEFARITSAMHSRAKSDFISSISHEVRSPLHGILGNAELLLDSNVEQEQRQMAEMIEKCGKSLLSTMDHILTYSKINSGSKEGRSPDTGSINDGAVLSSIDLSAVVEDSVDTLMAGNHFRALSSRLDSFGETERHFMSYERSAESESTDTQQQRGPLVNLAIDYCPSWSVVTVAPVWARCVMNLLGNALKYTDRGIIEVKLQLVPHFEGLTGRNTSTARLSISDTGRGMSSAYLRNHLFQPFLQENTSSNGVGLGLSIVKKLIDGLNGTVNVQSTVGKGTVVEISVPMRFESTTENEGPASPNYAGRKICLVGEALWRRPSLDADSLLRSRKDCGAVLSSTLSLYCRQWFDMEVSYAATLTDAVADVMVIFEDDLDSLRSSIFGDDNNRGDYLRYACVILLATSGTTKRPNLTKTNGIIYLTSPFGPRRFAATMKQAFEYTDKICETTLTAPVGRAIGRMPISKSKTKEAGPTKFDIAARARDASAEEREFNTPAPVLVLAVEDNDVNLKLLEKCFKRWGIAYRTASDGAQAVEVFQNSEKAFDYILMDISMPVMNGIEATRAIRNLEAVRHSRSRAQIIAMTGLGDERTRQQALASGMDVFLTKPIRLREVHALLQIKPKT